jgi:hypothetical protein
MSSEFNAQSVKIGPNEDSKVVYVRIVTAFLSGLKDTYRNGIEGPININHIMNLIYFMKAHETQIPDFSADNITVRQPCDQNMLENTLLDPNGDESMPDLVKRTYLRLFEIAIRFNINVMFKDSWKEKKVDPRYILNLIMYMREHSIPIPVFKYTRDVPKFSIDDFCRLGISCTDGNCTKVHSIPMKK